MNQESINTEKERFKNTLALISQEYGLQIDSNDPILYVLAFNRYLLNETGTIIQKSLEEFVNNIQTHEDDFRKSLNPALLESEEFIKNAIVKGSEHHAKAFQDSLKKISYSFEKDTQNFINEKIGHMENANNKKIEGLKLFAWGNSALLVVLICLISFLLLKI